jgi:nicotinate-nucleotide adenylyltransferase
LKRIGIFGGSFDPVHNAHVALAQVALEQLALDEIRWVPVWQAWQKTRRLAPAADREAMVRLAIAGEPRFVLERCELRRRGNSFTLDTVRELRAAEPDVEWYLILGQDQYAGLHTWRDWRELVALVTLVIAPRAGASRVDPQVASTPHRTVELPMMSESSTDIRSAIAAANRSMPWCRRRSRAILKSITFTSRPMRTAPTPGAEWTSASCNAPSSTDSKTSRPRTSSSSTPSTSRRCSNA